MAADESSVKAGRLAVIAKDRGCEVGPTNLRAGVLAGGQHRRRRCRQLVSLVDDEPVRLLVTELRVCGNAAVISSLPHSDPTHFFRPPGHGRRWCSTLSARRKAWGPSGRDSCRELAIVGTSRSVVTPESAPAQVPLRSAISPVGRPRSLGVLDHSLVVTAVIGSSPTPTVSSPAVAGAGSPPR